MILPMTPNKIEYTYICPDCGEEIKYEFFTDTIETKNDCCEEYKNSIEQGVYMRVTDSGQFRSWNKE